MHDKRFNVALALLLAVALLVPSVARADEVQVDPLAGGEASSQVTVQDETATQDGAATQDETATQGEVAAQDEAGQATEVLSEAETATGDGLQTQRDADGMAAAAQDTAANVADPSIRYTAHVQREGWKDEVADGAIGGTTGKSLRVEAIKIRLANVDAQSGGVEYQMHVQRKGWMDWARDGALGGTSGKSLRVEAFRLRLYGALAEQYDVWYRVHAQGIGWMAWTSNGETSGTSGSSLRIEAFQMRLAPKGQVPADLEQSDVPFAFAEDYNRSGLSVTAHVQRKGWLKAVGSGQTAGTTGMGLRVEALKMRLSNYPQGISYRAHVQKEGWQDWRSDGEVAGTMGKGRRIEAVAVQLYGDAANAYDIYYRAHVQGIGWMAWAKNGQTAGSLGLGLRVESLQVRLVPKGSSPHLPGGDYKGKAVDATTAKPSNMSIKLVPELAHGYKSPYYQRCIVMHDTTENRGFDFWIQNWIDRGGSGTQFMINEQGEIRQYVDMNQICWHVGGATYGYLDEQFNVVQHKAGAGSAMNQCSIGIEIDHVEDGRPYPKAQLDAIDRLVNYIDRYYGFNATILQHKDYKLDNSDCSDEFQGYLRHLQRYRTTR